MKDIVFKRWWKYVPVVVFPLIAISEGVWIAGVASILYGFIMLLQYQNDMLKN